MQAVDTHEAIKGALLEYIQERLEEIEKDLAMSHQEKYAHLEDVLESSVDEEEVKVAFEQWYNEHQSDLDLSEAPEDLWEQALSHLDESHL